MSLKKKIIIVDDHPLMRKGLSLTLESDPELSVHRQFDSAEEAIKGLSDESCDLIIIDISLPGMSGLELVKHIKAIYTHQKMLVISRHEENLYAERAIRAGAHGYIMKHEAGEVLLKAVRKILNGGIYLSDDQSERMIMGMVTHQKEPAESPMDLLSDRELEVFELTGNGYSAKEIAGKLHLSVKTVESYRARIKAKLDINNMNEFMLRAMQWVQGG